MTHIHTNREIHRCHVVPLVDEPSAQAAGDEIGRFHGQAIMSQIFKGMGSAVAPVLHSTSADIIDFFAQISHSYALAFVVAIRDGLATGAGDRLAGIASGLMVELDPAELAREIAALRQGFDAGFDRALDELASSRAQVPETATYEAPGPHATDDTNRPPQARQGL